MFLSGRQRLEMHGWRARHLYSSTPPGEAVLCNTRRLSSLASLDLERARESPWRPSYFFNLSGSLALTRHWSIPRVHCNSEAHQCRYCYCRPFCLRYLQTVWSLAEIVSRYRGCLTSSVNPPTAFQGVKVVVYKLPHRCIAKLFGIVNIYTVHKSYCIYRPNIDSRGAA